MPPAPGRVLLMDQDLSHKVTAPLAAAGPSRPRYSLVLKLVIHPALPTAASTGEGESSLQQVVRLAPATWDSPTAFGSALSCQPLPQEG